MKAGRFLWGLTVLGFGIVLVGNLAGYLDASVWTRLLALWPVVLVLLGLRFIIRNDYLMATVGMVIVVASFVLAVFYGSSTLPTMFPNNVTSTQNSFVSKVPGVNKVDVTVNTGAVELTIDILDADAAKTNLFSVKTIDMGNVSIDKQTVDDSYVVKIYETRPESVNSLGTKRKINLLVTPNVPVTINLKIGASKVNANLEKLNITGLVFKSGAISADVKLGGISKKAVIDLQSGVSSFVLNVPKSVGLSVTGKSGLSSLELPNGKTSLNFEDSYKSDGYDNAPKKIDLTVRSGLTSVKVINY